MQQYYLLIVLLHFYTTQNKQKQKEDDLFATITAQPDSDGTYFKSIKFPKEYFGFTQDEITSYKLVVSFPDGDRSADKQGIMEAIEIKINAKQRKE